MDPAIADGATIQRRHNSLFAPVIRRRCGAALLLQPRRLPDSLDEPQVGRLVARARRGRDEAKRFAQMPCDARGEGLGRLGGAPPHRREEGELPRVRWLEGVVEKVDCVVCGGWSVGGGTWWTTTRSRGPGGRWVGTDGRVPHSGLRSHNSVSRVRKGQGWRSGVRLAPCSGSQTVSCSSGRGERRVSATGWTGRPRSKMNDEKRIMPCRPARSTRAHVGLAARVAACAARAACRS